MENREYIINEILRIAKLVGADKLSRREFSKHTDISNRQVRYYFGSWNNAREAAGLNANLPGRLLTYHRESDDVLLRAILTLWKTTGNRPTVDMMNARGDFSEKPYRARWGTFNAAVDEAIHRFGVPNMGAGSPEDVSYSSPAVLQEVASPEMSKPAILSPNLQVNNYVGEPVDFRGMRYGPTNEQGVVYLFGMVARELGFVVESIQAGFPDCQCKRCLDSEALKWGHTRVEFEFRSSNFAEHGHNPDGCDLIICWVHDWPEASIEVLELRKAIRKLPSRL